MYIKPKSTPSLDERDYFHLSLSILQLSQSFCTIPHIFSCFFCLSQEYSASSFGVDFLSRPKFHYFKALRNQTLRLGASCNVLIMRGQIAMFRLIMYVTLLVGKKPSLLT